MKRRYKITNPVRFFIFVCIVTLTIIFAAVTFIGSADTEAAVVETYKPVTVHADDTLWSIAEEYCDSSKDIRIFIDEICDINDISAGDVHNGDIVIVPVSM